MPARSWAFLFKRCSFFFIDGKPRSKISVYFVKVIYTIVDIETTGGSPKSSKITEIAIFKHDGTQVIDQFQTLINPEMPIPEFITRLTGISDRMVEEAPKFYEVAKQIVEFTEGTIFVAHNVGFDYGMIRQEFKRLGYDFRLPHLCTVRSSRYVIPGEASYSLGKLTRSLGIELNGRHRAGGDALATAHLFTLLMEKDPNGLKTFIQEEVNPKILHPNLNLEELDEIPNKTGIYRFYNEVNQLIYIGKSKQIRKRIDQHLRNTKTTKGIQMINEVARIEFELTGSELIALLYESSLIKQYQPKYNRALRKNKFPYGLFHYMDELGYIHFYSALTSKSKEVPLASFSTKKEATNYLEYICEKYNLCQKLCDIYATKSSCFNYEVKKCNGACIQKEPAEAYNERCQEIIDELHFNGDSFFIIDKGRHKSEKSLVMIQRGSYAGYGFAPYHFNNKQSYQWHRFIKTHTEDRDARTIINVYLRKNANIEIVKF